MPSVGLELGYDITDYVTVFVANKLYLGASNKIDGEVHIDDNKDKLNYLNLGLNVYFGKKSATLPRIRDYESVPSKILIPATKSLKKYKLITFRRLR